MKKILLLLGIAAGFFANAQSTQAPHKVGYANMEYIISQLPDVKQMETEMKSTQTQLRTQIQTKTKEVEKEYADFNQNMNTMTDTVRATRQRDLEKAMGDLEKMQQDAQVTLQNKQKLFMAPIYLKVNRAIGEVAKENGYAIILTETISNYPFVLYHQPQMDVSNLVLQKFGVTPAATEKK
ncbi:MAG: OmpH family outer membrane protein [Chryseosolibacter sp.]